MVHSYCCQREHKQYPGYLLQCSSCLQQREQKKKKHNSYHLTCLLTHTFNIIERAHSLSAYSPHSDRFGSGPGVALCLPSWRQTPSERTPLMAARYMHSNSRGGDVMAISADICSNGKEFSTMKSGRRCTLTSKHSVNNRTTA